MVDFEEANLYSEAIGGPFIYVEEVIKNANGLYKL